MLLLWEEEWLLERLLILKIKRENNILFLFFGGGAEFFQIKERGIYIFNGHKGKSQYLYIITFDRFLKIHFQNFGFGRFSKQHCRRICKSETVKIQASVSSLTALLASPQDFSIRWFRMLTCQPNRTILSCHTLRKQHFLTFPSTDHVFPLQPSLNYCFIPYHTVSYQFFLINSQLNSTQYNSIE